MIAGTSGAGVAGVPLLTAIDAALGWRAALGGLTLAALASLLLVRLAVAPSRRDWAAGGGLCAPTRRWWATGRPSACSVPRR